VIALWRRLFPQPIKLPVLPVLPAPAQPDAEVARLRWQLAGVRIELSKEIGRRRRAEQRADLAEQILTELSAGRGSAPLVAENEHLRKALLELDDFAEGCRLAHGGNTKASAVPTHPGVPA
jgi:hypothetical protein